MREAQNGGLRTNPDNANWPKYRLFGLTLASSFPFANRLVTAEGPADLSFACVAKPPCTARWKQSDPVYASLAKNAKGQSWLYLYRQPDYEVLHYPDVADFYLGSKDIICQPLNSWPRHVIEIRLLGTVMSYCLERRGVPMLHASAVVVGGQAVAFLATNSGGKSSLAASLMKLGHPLLTDDLLPIQSGHETFLGCAGYPQMRMWPDQAEYFLGHYEDLDQVHPAYSKRRVPVGPDGLGLFCASPHPLARFYLPERRNPDEFGREIEITPLRGSQAMIEFVRNSFAARLVEQAGLQPERMKTLARMARQVPVHRIAYPSGVEHLARVRKAILADLATTPELRPTGNPVLAWKNSLARRGEPGSALTFG
jgi:hypothetical protein